MSHPLRVALFTDSYDEANGVARLSQTLETYAATHGLPLLCVHGSATTCVTDGGTSVRLALKRSAASFRLEHDLSFDLLLWRHYRMVAWHLKTFRPDVLHITGPSDVGQLGALLGHRLSIPIIGSWHTNLHQYASLRLRNRLHWLPRKPRGRVLALAEQAALDASLWFYQIPRVLMAPNQELVTLLAGRLNKPTHLLSHGVDTNVFTPDRRPRHDDDVLHLGFVGRLSAEKRVDLLPVVERAIRASGMACRFVIVGDGAQRAWLETQMPTAQFCGILTGDALARAYANFDVFVFPSESETFGLVVLEAMASGVPVIAMARGGPAFVVERGASGCLAADDRQFVDAAVSVVKDRELRLRLGQGARAAALKWSWDRVFERLYEVYAETARMGEPAQTFAPAPSTP